MVKKGIRKNTEPDAGLCIDAFKMIKYIKKFAQKMSLPKRSLSVFRHILNVKEAAKMDLERF